MKKITIFLFLTMFTFITVNTAYAANGWVKDGNITYYYKDDGTKATGWQKINNKQYYFYSTGGMATGWLNLPNNRKFNFNSDGTMNTGWKVFDNKRYYFYSTGGMATGWLTLPNNREYYLDKNGVAMTGTRTIDGKTYLFSSTGELLSADIKTGWVKDGSTTYYYKNDGTLATGWQTINNKNYYFYSTGGMATGWLHLPNNRKFYFNSDGTMKTGWMTQNNKKYYFYSTGGMATGWLPLPNNQKYYFNSDGVMVTNNITLNGKRYSFFSNGNLKSETTFTNYSSTLNQMVNTNLNLNPPGQTDKYRNDPSYVHKDYLDLSADKTKGTVNDPVGLNVREGAGTQFRKVGFLRYGQTVTVLSGQNDDGDWYQIAYGAWKNATPEDIEYYIDPKNFDENTSSYFQFLNLSENTGIPASELNNKILYNKGILKGTGQAFIDGSKQYGVNELYLIAHAFLETGNGSSTLAKGVLVSSVDGKAVEPRTVYNMYGIGAVDSDPIRLGSEYAYKAGWFTPEASIIGGAQFIGERYINHQTYQQDTLYKMRWNPERPGVHQYATDIGWAAKQVWNMYNMYGLLDYYTLYFEVPVYKE